MRRIEAVTGAAADRLARERSEALERVAAAVGAQTLDAVEDRIVALQEELRETKRRLKAGAGVALPKPSELLAAADEPTPGLKVVVHAAPFESTEQMTVLAKQLVAAGAGYVALFSTGDAPALVAIADDAAQQRGISAGGTVTVAAPLIGGRGGGRPGMGQARGDRVEGVDAAIAAVRQELQRMLSQG
jgi:alanyl-tRNA synthetase